MAETIPVIAGGDIYPSRFVSMGAADYTVIESNSGDLDVVGVTDESTKNAPQTGGSDLHASAGDRVRYHPYGEDPLLELAGSVTRGGYIKPDNDGKGVAATTTNDVAFAIAWESGSSGEKIKVKLISAYYVQ